MRAPLYASSEFPNANPDLHAGRIDPSIFPDVEDAFGDGEVTVVDELPELASSEAEIELVGQPPEAPRDSMVRLVAAIATPSSDDLESGDEGDDLDIATFSSLTLPTLPPIAPDLFAIVAEADVESIIDVPVANVTAEIELAAETTVEASDAAPTAIETETETMAEAPVAETTDEEPAIASAPESVPAEAPVAAIVSEVAPREAIAFAWTSEETSANDAAAATDDDAVTDPFVHLVRAICEATRSVGHDAPEGALVELLSGRPVPSALFGIIGASLVAAGVAQGGDGESLVLAAKTAAPAREWAKIVRDEGGDFEACGGKTLDEFAAEIAAAIIGDRSKLEPLRRALRSHGVAAYGIVVAA